jgi:hypothetical protein
MTRQFCGYVVLRVMAHTHTDTRTAAGCRRTPAFALKQKTPVFIVKYEGFRTLRDLTERGSGGEGGIRTHGTI